MTKRSTDAGASEADLRGPEWPPLARRTFLGVTGGAALSVALGGGGLGYFLSRVNRVAEHPPKALRELRRGETTALFRRHPRLADVVPWRPLGAFPTPVERLPLPHGAPEGELLVKRDDLASDVYGGNKVRKLEHFLAEAELCRRTGLVTLGGLGTNHGLATAIHGRRLGFEVDLALYDQPRTEEVERTLRAFERLGARTHLFDSEAGAFLGARRVMARERGRGASPFFINVGGTSRLGTLGYVNAAFELAEQIRDGELPVPDRIFVALGTCGTAAGLLAGLRLAGIPSVVCAVRVTGIFPANRFMVRHFAADVAGWLREREPAVETGSLPLERLEVIGDQRGPGYAVPTPEAREALEWAAPRLALETTYTGKALAACLEYCRSGMRPGEAVLFWHTWAGTRDGPVPLMPGP
jgi:D-cysteine desulfhydrase